MPTRLTGDSRRPSSPSDWATKAGRPKPGDQSRATKTLGDQKAHGKLSVGFAFLEKVFSRVGNL